MSDLPPGEWSLLLVGHQWPTISAVEILTGAATTRKTAAAALDNYADTLQSVRTGPLSNQEGATAEDIRQLFGTGENHARETSSKNFAKSDVYKSAGESVASLREDLSTIAARGNAAIQAIQTSNKPAPTKIGEIVDAVVQAQTEASVKAADHSANLFTAIADVLNRQDIPLSAREFAKANGVDLAQAFGSPSEETVRQQVTALYNKLKSSPPTGTSSAGENLFLTGQDGAVVPPASPRETAPMGGGAIGDVRDSIVPPPQPVPPASAPSTAEAVGGGQDAFVRPIQSPLTGPQPHSAVGGGVRPPAAATTPLGPPTGVPAPQASVSSLPSAATPTNALSPEGIAQNFTTGAQAGAPMSSGTESLSHSAMNAVQPQAPFHPEAMATGHLASTTPSAGGPLFDTAHAATHTPVDATAPTTVTPDTTLSVLAAPAASAMPATAPPVSATPTAPAGPLPAYGADLRPPAATSPAGPTPPPAAATPASAPVNPSSTASSLTQPAVVRQQPAAAPFKTQPPVGITENAITATTAGALAGASSAQSAAQLRLQRLLDAVARQQPALGWAIGDREDHTTVLATDLASGWIPPHIQIPTGITLLSPGHRRRTGAALLGDTTLTATYTPGQYLPPADDAEPVSMSIRARQTAEVEELGWELAQATKWRDGLPRLAHTLAKAVSAGTGYLDSEVDLLREHLVTVAKQVLAEYPDDVDPARVGNWQLMATIEALIKGEKICANYHLAWFQALSLALKGADRR